MTTLERREFLKASGAGLASFSLPLPRGHVEWAFAGQDVRPSLVVIYLRGGIDAINAVVPYRDERYRALRPTLAIPAESSEQAAGVVDLDGHFGLHPALAPLLPLWESEQLAPIVNVGSHHPTRSHFDAQDFMEYAAPGLRTVRDGWLNRYLALTHEPPGRGEQEGELLRALAMQGLLPRSLRGRHPVLAVPEKDVLQDGQVLDLFGSLYGEQSGGAPQEEGMQGTDRDAAGAGPVEQAGRNTLETLERYRRMVSGGQGATDGAYPQGRFAAKLRDLAQVIRAGQGLEVAALDLNGWDTHARQGGLEGTMPDLLTTLAGALASFAKDLGPRMDSTLVLVMSEFGRTCSENGNYGTDHGHGGLMLLLGGGVAGGKVHGQWTGLEKKDLYQGRDLEVTTDFRDVLGEVLRKHLRFDPPRDYFPDYRHQRVRGLFG